MIQIRKVRGALAPITTNQVEIDHLHVKLILVVVTDLDHSILLIVAPTVVNIEKTV